MQEYRKNLGKVSLTAEGAWTKDKSFDILSIVYDEHTLHGFISKQYVPEGVDLYNKEYWMPFNVSGYSDNNIIILSEKTSETSIKAYTLEEAINSVATVGRRPGMILGFYNENTDRLDIGGRWEIWQFNSTTISEWEDIAHWQNIYYSFNKFVGWYRDVESLKKYNPFPEIGCYAYVGTEFNEATIYRCDTKFIWTDTTQHAWDYIKVIVQGNVTVGENGNWFNDGVDTGIPASIKGENGKTPVFRQYDNTIQYSFDNVNWITISDKVAAWFRWNVTTDDTQANNVGRIQISRDNVTWTNLSGDIINKLHISRYIGADESLPTSGIAEGTIYAKGPYYAEDDTLNDNPIYRLWVYAWKGNTLAWQDNGEFTSISAGVVQETGDSETEVMSQKATTEKLTELGSEIDEVNTVSDDVFSIKGQFIYTDGQLMSSPNFVCTDFIYIKGIDYIYFKAEENQQNLYLAVYGKDKKFNSGSQQQFKNNTEWSIIKFEESDYYIRFSKRLNTKFYIDNFNLIVLNEKNHEEDYGNPFVIDATFIDTKKKGLYFNSDGDEVNSGVDYYGITKELIPLYGTVYLKGIEENGAVNVVFYGVNENKTRVLNIGTKYTEITLENDELFFRLSINTKTPLFLKGSVSSDYRKVSIPNVYNNGYIIWSANDSNLKKDVYIPSILKLGDKISFISANNSIVTNKVHLSEEEYYIVDGAMNNHYEGIFFCDENDKIVGIITKGQETDIFKSWNNKCVFRTPVGTKYAYITISLTQTLDKPLNSIKVLQWNGVDEYLVDGNLICNNYASDIVYEKEYIKDFDNSEVIYNSLEDANTLADYYYALNNDGILNAYKEKLPEGSGWSLSKEIDVTPCSTIRIEGLDYSNWNGKTVIFRHGVEGGYSYIGYIWGRSYTNKKRTQNPYRYDTRNFAFTSLQEFKVPYGCTSIRLVIKTSQDSDIVPIVIKKWDGKYKNTYRLRNKRIDFSNLTWAALGDSVTWLNSHPWGSGSQGTGMTIGYQDIVRKSIKFKDVQDYAQNGQCLVNIPGQYLLNQKDIWAKADIYTIMLGINSCTTIANSKLGTLDDFRNKTGSNTLYGAWREMLDYIYRMNPSAYVFICTPHQIISASTDDGIKTVEGYDVVNNVSIEIAKLNNIPIIDIYHESGINVYNNSITTYDGVHPSDEGYKRIGAMIIDSFKKHIFLP